jgi:hypothetical protein
MARIRNHAGVQNNINRLSPAAKRAQLAALGDFSQPPPATTRARDAAARDRRAHAHKQAQEAEALAVEIQAATAAKPALRTPRVRRGETQLVADLERQIEVLRERMVEKEAAKLARANPAFVPTFDLLPEIRVAMNAAAKHGDGALTKTLESISGQLVAFFHSRDIPLPKPRKLRRTVGAA